MNLNRILVLPQFLVLLFSLSGCLGTTSSTQFYLLEPISDSVSKANDNFKDVPLIALTPVHIPDYIDRPQIIMANNKNIYQLSEFDRWAEPLDTNIGRVLQLNLTYLIPAKIVLSKDSNLAKQAGLRVSVNILEFHIDARKQAVLTAQWHVIRGEKTIANNQKSYQILVVNNDLPFLVHALNQCLEQLSRDVASSVRQ